MIPFFFFFNDTATTEIYTLSLHDALPISRTQCGREVALGIVDLVEHVRVDAEVGKGYARRQRQRPQAHGGFARRSEEHTSELQSRLHLVCRLLLEKKKKKS